LTKGVSYTRENTVDVSLNATIHQR